MIYISWQTDGCHPSPLVLAAPGHIQVPRKRLSTERDKLAQPKGFKFVGFLLVKQVRAMRSQ